MKKDQEIILSSVAEVLKTELAAIRHEIDQVAPGDHTAIPAVATALIKQARLEVREYALSALNLRSKAIHTHGTPPAYVRALDR